MKQASGEKEDEKDLSVSLVEGGGGGGGEDDLAKQLREEFAQVYSIRMVQVYISPNMVQDSCTRGGHGPRNLNLLETHRV